MTEPIATVLDRLAAWPVLRGLLHDLIDDLAGPDTTIALSGSVARGEVDPHSDLDLLVVCPDAERCAARRERLHAFLGRYEVLALFDAAHLGLACLDSVFLVTGGVITKVDVMVWAAPDGAPPAGGLVVHDGPGLASLVPPAAAGPPEVERAPRDIVGWVCHVRKIIGRGELFEAAHCVDEMRRRMLVPILLRRHRLPQVNYRRLEARLPADEVAVLARTHPADLTAGELDRALRELVAQFVGGYRRLPEEARTEPTQRVEAALSRALTAPVAQTPAGVDDEAGVDGEVSPA